MLPDMRTVSWLIVACGAGCLLGFLYFMGLWQMVQKLTSAKSPARVVLGSLVLRMALVLSGFYLVMGSGHWERLLAAMLGFVLMRKILTYRMKPQQALPQGL